MKRFLYSFTCAWFICLILTILRIVIPWERFDSIAVLGRWTSVYLIDWRQHYVRNLAQAADAKEKLGRLCLSATELFHHHIEKIVAVVTIYELSPMLAGLYRVFMHVRLSQHHANPLPGIH